LQNADICKKNQTMNAHEIDYRIHGEEMQHVEIELDPNETTIAESGAFMMMDEGIQMETIFGDGTPQTGGLMGKLFSAGKRLLTGESLFMTAFTNVGQGKKKVHFASPYPGKIMALNLAELGGKMICQKDAFLCAAKGVSVGIEFQRKLGGAFLVVKDLLCRSWKATVWPLCMRAVTCLSVNWLRAKP